MRNGTGAAHISTPCWETTKCLRCSALDIVCSSHCPSQKSTSRRAVAEFLPPPQSCSGCYMREQEAQKPYPSDLVGKPATRHPHKDPPKPKNTQMSPFWPLGSAARKPIDIDPPPSPRRQLRHYKGICFGEPFLDCELQKGKKRPCGNLGLRGSPCFMDCSRG